MAHFGVRGLLQHIAFFYGGELAPRPLPQMEEHSLSATAHSIYSQITSTFKGRLDHKQPKGASCGDDSGPLSIQTVLIIGQLA
jgi:hypothetical protein